MFFKSICKNWAHLRAIFQKKKKVKKNELWRTRFLKGIFWKVALTFNQSNQIHPNLKSSEAVKNQLETNFTNFLNIFNFIFLNLGGKGQEKRPSKNQHISPKPNVFLTMVVAVFEWRVFSFLFMKNPDPSTA